MVRAWTIVGAVHGTWPWMALAHTPGEMLSEMAWRVSSLKAVCPTPWTKQVMPCALNVAQSPVHCARVVGGVRWYWVNRSWLIQTVPEYTAPTETAASLLPTMRLETPIGDSLDCQSLPIAFSTADVRSIV